MSSFTARTFVVTWVGLAVLTTATLLASFSLRGSTGLLTALAFALAKSCLVIWIFMHLKEEPPITRSALAAGVLLVTLIVALVVGDVALRTPLSAQLPTP